MLRSIHLVVPAVLAVAWALSLPPGAPLVEQVPVVDGAAAPARVHPLSDAEVAAASATIDRMLAADLAAHGQQPNPAADDATFLRRAYLAVLGRIPSVEEAGAWLRASEPDKRDRLISELQRQPGRVHADFTWWADLLRISSTLGKRYPGLPYIDWIKQQIRADTAYDVVVRQLLTASGPALARGNGATGYYLRDAGMPLDNMANSVQVFLGTRVQCAQCHNHPFDVWTRKEFYELAAYTDSVHLVRGGNKIAAYARKQADGAPSPELKKALKLLGTTVGLEIRGGQRAELELPADYQYPDGTAGQKVAATALFGPAAPVAVGGSAQAAFAEWVVSPDNPRFTTVIANRMWKRAFGAGIVEPVDNFTEKTQPTNPALLAYLGKLMVSVDYDLERFQRILYQTDAWQRASTPPDATPADGYRFPGPLLRRLSAEELWDSLVTLVVPDPDARSGATAERLYKFYDDTKDKDAKGLYELAMDLSNRRGRAQELMAQLGTLRAKLKTLPAGSATAQDVARQIQAVEDQRDRLAAEIEDAKGAIPRRNQRLGDYVFLRADELPSPAPLGHVLRTYGQSDREVIEAANSSPSSTQALILLNGFVDQELLPADSLLSQRVQKASTPAAAVDTLFLAILTRPPSADERRTVLAGEVPGVSPTVQAALRDLTWVLVNSNEFLFVK